MNLKFIQKSRKAHKAGDVFAYSLGEGLYRFGAIIRTNAKANQGGGKWPMCYVYKSASKSLSDIPELDDRKLLLHPFMINLLPWSRGYFVTVDHRPLTEAVRSKLHYFRKEDGSFVDEYHRPVKTKPKVYSSSGLWSFAYFDYMVSKELGLPVEEDE